MSYSSLRLISLTIGLVSLGALARPGLGAPAVFFDRDNSSSFMFSFPNSLAKFNQFTASLNSFGIDNVDTAVGGNPTLSFGATGITATTQGVKAQIAPGFQIGAQALLESDTDPPFTPVNTTFTFNQHINAFGLYVINGGDIQNNDPNSNNNPTTFRLRDTVANSFVDVPVQVGPGWGLDNVFFLGVTDTVSFNQVELIESIDVADGMLYDNIIAGRVPEPGSLVLVTLAAACALCRPIRLRRG